MSETQKFHEILEILLVEQRFELHDFLVEMIELLDPDYNTESSESDDEIIDGINESLEVNVDGEGFYSVR